MGRLGGLVDQLGFKQLMGLGDNSVPALADASAETELAQVRRWRDRQALKTASTGVAVQILNYAVRAAVIPLSLKLLGSERYGLWLAVGSLVAWGGLADLGLSTGLVNVVAKASGRGDLAEMRRHISSGLAAYAGIATILLGTVLLVSKWGGLPRLLGVANNAALVGDARVLVAVCGMVFAMSVWGQTFSMICSGLQEGYSGSFASLAGSVGSLVLLLPLLWRGASLLAYALVMGLPLLAAQLGLGAFLFGSRHRELLPSWRLCNGRSLRMVFNIGGPMALDQFANIGILYSANILIANRLSPAVVPKYAIPYSLFAIVNGAAYLIANSYMPAFAEASANADWNWIRRRASRSLYANLGVVTAINAVLLIAARNVIAVWAGHEMVPTIGFLLALASYSLLRAYSETNGVLLVGLGLVKIKALLQLMVAVIMVAGGWFLLPKLGLPAIPILGSVGCGLNGALALPCAVRHLRRKEADAGSIYLAPQAFLHRVADAKEITNSQAIL